MTFDKWHDWAMGNHATSPRDNGKTWERVATHARHDACYDATGCGDDFRERLGDEFGNEGPFGFGVHTYKTVCREKDEDDNPKFQLQGKTVDGKSPPFLSRVVRIEGFIGNVNEAAGGYLPVDEQEDLEEALENANDWTSLASLSIPTLSRGGAYLAHPNSVRVFSTVGAADEGPGGTDSSSETVESDTGRMQQDDSPPSASREPSFWQWLGEKRASYSLSIADLAVQALALGSTPAAPREYVYLYYRRETVGKCRYPTPPDAEFFDQFRPVDPSEQPFGRTHPVIDGTHVEDLAVWEVVHKNDPMTLDQVWVRTL